MHIHRIGLGFVGAWLIASGGRWIVVDAGKRRTAPKFLAKTAAAGCRARDIALIVLTHAHYDHVGGAAALQALSGAPVAIHRADAETLRTGVFVLSDGLNALGRAKAFLGRRVMPRAMFAFPPVNPDILIDDEYRLDGFGFAATLIPTPGHSAGSLSLLTDDGALFPGDLAITQPLFGRWRYMPLYGESVEAIQDAWRMLLARGARQVYPSHGRDFPASELAKWL